MTQRQRFHFISQDAIQHQALAGILSGANVMMAEDRGHESLLRDLESRPLDILFIDVEYPGAVGIIQTCQQHRPALPIVAVARVDQLETLRLAMLAGARGFVTVPFAPPSVLDTVSTVIAENRSQGSVASRGLCIATTSLKGGVGKSTLAANLAVAIQQHKKRDVILLEGHHGLSDLAIMLNVYPPHTIEALADEPEIDADVVKGLLHHHSSGIQFLSAPTTVADMVELPARSWNSLLNVLTHLADVVIVDTAPSADAALAQVLSFADHALVVTSPEMPGLRRALDVIEAMAADANNDIEAHLILNRADMPGGIREVDITNKIGEEVAMSLPYDPTLTTYALNRGIPFVLSHPRSRLSHRIFSLADMLLPEASKQESQSGLSLPKLGINLSQRFSNQSI